VKALFERIESAATCEDLFGALTGDADAQLLALSVAWRRIARDVHPDRHPARPTIAQAAFVKATTLRRHAETKIRAGTYGDRRPPAAPTVITTRRRSYYVGDLLVRGDLCDLYATDFDGTKAVLKIARSGADSDLVEREAETLRGIWPNGEPEEKFYRYLPRILDSFIVRGDDGHERRANVMPRFDSHVSLAELLEMYPSGLDFRDVVWMTKRLLVALGFVHRQGIVHGAVLPPHVLVQPIDHGARLVDWCYAAPDGTNVRAMGAAFRDLVAPEIPKKQPASPATDIYMAAKCALRLLGTTDAPREIRQFFATCTVASPARRPDDAWKLHEEFDALLLRLVGKPTYRPLELRK
jgi:serine/threonine protein kinase